MNIENINRTIEELRKTRWIGDLGDERQLMKEDEIVFDMSDFKSNICGGPLNERAICGTACCIAGLICETLIPGKPVTFYIDQVGTEFLDLSRKTAWRLFYGDGDKTIELHNITVEAAIHCLEVLRDTGVVDWKGAMKATRK